MRAHTKKSYNMKAKVEKANNQKMRNQWPLHQRHSVPFYLVIGIIGPSTVFWGWHYMYSTTICILESKATLERTRLWFDGFRRRKIRWLPSIHLCIGWWWHYRTFISMTFEGCCYQPITNNPEVKKRTVSWPSAIDGFNQISILLYSAQQYSMY